MRKYDNFIYLLKIDTPDCRLYKIGSTRGSIHERIKSLQTGCPYEIRLIEKYDSIVSYTEDWMSGLNQRFTKPSNLYWFREFESHILRKIMNPLQSNGRFIFCERM